MNSLPETTGKHKYWMTLPLLPLVLPILFLYSIAGTIARGIYRICRYFDAKIFLAVISAPLWVPLGFLYLLIAAVASVLLRWALWTLEDYPIYGRLGSVKRFSKWLDRVALFTD